MKPWRTYTNAMELVDSHLKGSVQPHDTMAKHITKKSSSIRSRALAILPNDITSFRMKCTQKALCYQRMLAIATNVCFSYSLAAYRTLQLYGCCAVVLVSNTGTARTPQALSICVRVLCALAVLSKRLNRLHSCVCDHSLVVYLELFETFLLALLMWCRR